MSSWMYKGNKGKDPEKEFFGCAATPDWKDHNWCYVQGGAECSDAKDSETKGETRKFIECDAKAEEKFLISQDEPVESSSNFGTMCLAAFAGTAVLGGLALLSFKRIQRGRARENPVSVSAEGEMDATETPMLVRTICTLTTPSNECVAVFWAGLRVQCLRQGFFYHLPTL